MNEQRSFQQPAPGPMCAALAPLLPLLSLGKLEPEEAISLREHVATCDFCQGRLRDFDTLRDALRQEWAPARDTEPAASEPALTLAAILAAVQSDDMGKDIGEDGERTETFDLDFDELSTRPIAPPARGAAHGRRRWTALSALAAVLLLSLLAGALFRWHTERTALVVPVPGLGTLTEFPVPTAHSQPSLIVAGRDGNLWFDEQVGNYPTISRKIGRITPQGVITEFALPDPQGVVLGGVVYGVSGLAAGSDGTIWFTVESSLSSVTDRIFRLNPRDGKVAEFALPTGGAVGPIVAGPDGNLWFVTSYTNPVVAGQSLLRGAIGRLTPGGAITVFTLPDQSPVGSASAVTPPPFALTAGPGGDVWFVAGDERALGHYVVGRVSPAGVITEFSIPTSVLNPNMIDSIAAGPDGNLWFTASANGWYPGQIGRISPQGTITEFRVPGNNVSTTYMPTLLTAGPDGNLWFVAGVVEGGDGHTLGRITPQGAIAEFALPRGATFSQGTAYPQGITAGPDGSLWFTDATANTIDRLVLHP